MRDAHHHRDPHVPCRRYTHRTPCSRRRDRFSRPVFVSQRRLYPTWVRRACRHRWNRPRGRVARRRARGHGVSHDARQTSRPRLLVGRECRYVLAPSSVALTPTVWAKKTSSSFFTVFVYNKPTRHHFLQGRHCLGSAAKIGCWTASMSKSWAGSAVPTKVSPTCINFIFYRVYAAKSDWGGDCARFLGIVCGPLVFAFLVFLLGPDAAGLGLFVVARHLGVTTMRRRNVFYMGFTGFFHLYRGQRQGRGVMHLRVKKEEKATKRQGTPVDVERPQKPKNQCAEKKKENTLYKKRREIIGKEGSVQRRCWPR